MRTLAIATSLVAATLACRTTSNRAEAEQPIRTVADADLGRLASGQMGPVDEARAMLHEARDAVARAKYRLRDSRHEEDFAKADRTAAEADRLRAAAELAQAKDAGDERLAGIALERGAAAALRAQAAEARLDYARKLAQAREAELRAAQARVRRGEWEIERAKLSALRNAGVPEASKYESTPIDRRVAEAVRAEEAAQERAFELAANARAAHDQWRALTERYEARVGSIPTG